MDKEINETRNLLRDGFNDLANTIKVLRERHDALQNKVYEISEALENTQKIRADHKISAIPNLSGKNEIYFFFKSRYICIDTSADTIRDGGQILEKWSGLSSSQFCQVNSVFVLPGQYDEAYFCNGPQCVKLDLSSGDIREAPCAISTKLLKLSAFGFKNISAVLPLSAKGHNYEKFACLFSGHECALLDIKERMLMDRDSITNKFKALERAGFNTVDGAVFVPTHQNREACFFSGTKCVFVDLQKDTTIGEVQEVKQKWKSLAGFY